MWLSPRRRRTATPLLFPGGHNQPSVVMDPARKRLRISLLSHNVGDLSAGETKHTFDNAKLPEFFPIGDFTTSCRSSSARRTGKERARPLNADHYTSEGCLGASLPTIKPSVLILISLLYATSLLGTNIILLSNNASTAHLPTIWIDATLLITWRTTARLPLRAVAVQKQRPSVIRRSVHHGI